MNSLLFFACCLINHLHLGKSRAKRQLISSNQIVQQMVLASPSRINCFCWTNINPLPFFFTLAKVPCPWCKIHAPRRFLNVQRKNISRQLLANHLVPWHQHCVSPRFLLQQLYSLTCLISMFGTRCLAGALMVAILLMAQVSDALYFYLEGSEKKCFLEELPQETLVTGALLLLCSALFLLLTFHHSCPGIYKAEQFSAVQNQWIVNPEVKIQITVEVNAGYHACVARI